jgi:hypothetical protein
MPIDPLVSLAVTVQSNKGVYALLVGSGVSRSAGVPTGWDVVLDLIRRVAVVRGEPCEPDPVSWYRTVVGGEPSYSVLLDELTSSPSERMGLLRGYFEPTPEEREQGLKVPTAAHHAIASLVASGYVRVVVTTNFDGLLEQALRAAGVNPTVISTTAAVQGAVPLVHSSCTLIKVHGDYLDPTLKNTTDELAAYDPLLDELLDRVFDEYGLLVCGWSVEWDLALRTALERCSTRRFGTYWTAFGTLSDSARKLVDLRRASVLPITGADEFFTDLQGKVQALEDGLLTDPLAPSVAVARLKRHLATGQYIYAHDLLHEEVERVMELLTLERYPAQVREFSIELFMRRLAAYQADLATLLPLMICAAQWAPRANWAVLSRVIQRVGEERDLRNGLVIFLNLQRYPAHLLFYAAGIAALAKGRYALLKHLFATPLRNSDKQQTEPAMNLLHTGKVMQDQKGIIPGKERDHTPLSNYVFEALRHALRECIPSDVEYESLFGWFEFLLALSYTSNDATVEVAQQIREDDQGKYYIWSPVGRFSWNRRNREGLEREARITDPTNIPPLAQKIINAGLCRPPKGGGSDAEWYMAMQKGMDLFLQQVRVRHW